MILIKLLCNFIKITLRHGCPSVICRIFAEYLFTRTPLEGCFCSDYERVNSKSILFLILFNHLKTHKCLFYFSDILQMLIYLQNSLVSIHEDSRRKYCFHNTVSPGIIIMIKSVRLNSSVHLLQTLSTIYKI